MVEARRARLLSPHAVLRVERSPRDLEWDSRARRAIAELPLFYPAWKSVRELAAETREVFWVRVDAEKAAASKIREALAREVLRDPLHETSFERSRIPASAAPGFRWWCLEKSFRPGVTDNTGGVLSEAVSVVTGRNPPARSGARLWIFLPDEIAREAVADYATHVFCNPLIERFRVFDREEALAADSELFSAPEWIEIGGEASAESVEYFEVATAEPAALSRLSEERLWALSGEELAAIAGHYRRLGRKASDVELEVLAQTWSEHCKHKIFAAEIEVENQRGDVRLPATVKGVFKTYIKGATERIAAEGRAPFLRSVFEDNAGIVEMTEELLCAIKVETHNSPSALDPYGGALTGIVGVNRDILGAGLGAYPIANLDVFCVGPLDAPETLPPRLHHPRRILEGVRMGVEHGGNKSGIPTVTGAVVHHPKFLGKPLVFCGTVGLIPAAPPDGRDLTRKEIQPGDHIVMSGGRIGKDGIHGATFSSMEMKESSPVSAVQLGDPLTQKRVWDFLIEARDAGLFRAVTDNGAGGLSSSVGELARLCGKRGGARMDVSAAKTKYQGLKPYELVVSESQERMTFAVAPEKLEAFLDLSRRRGVESSVLGQFADSGVFRIQYGTKTVAELKMEFLHDGAPGMRLKARVKPPEKAAGGSIPKKYRSRELGNALLETLSHPNVRSRRELVSQYDHEVQARSVRKPYGSPGHRAPGDGATLRLSRETHEGVALGLGLAPEVAAIDPKVAAELALDEALRNAACAGMDPSHAVLVDNFCWPDPLPGPHNADAEEKLGALVVTCQRLFDGAVELGMPFVSGKDSMKNDYRMGDVKISVAPTVLITAMGKVRDVRLVPRGHAGQMDGPRGHADASRARKIYWLSGQELRWDGAGLPVVAFARTRRFLAKFHDLVCDGAIAAAHDVSDGGWLVAMAEMLLGTETSARLVFTEKMLQRLRVQPGEPAWASLFSEPATSFVILAAEDRAAEIEKTFASDVIFDAGEITPAGARDAGLTLELEGAKPVWWRLKSLEEAYEG
ncbi:MAG: phosphoribosylformylglycinamidine synthase [Deltaproteobacteria bacterium]|nr:phosphoribosylformylglycinamidine synthase [Deltaproteobacteria bacterium]